MAGGGAGEDGEGEGGEEEEEASGLALLGAAYGAGAPRGGAAGAAPTCGRAPPQPPRARPAGGAGAAGAPAPAAGAGGAGTDDGDCAAPRPGAGGRGRRRGKRREPGARSGRDPPGRGSKAVRAQFQKWASARAELGPDDAGGDWRTEQLRNGRADGNPNLEPVAEDWRRRLRAASPAAAPGPGADAPPAPPARAAVPDLVALAEGLPGGWLALWDGPRRRVFYAHAATGETTARRPRGPAPPAPPGPADAPTDSSRAPPPAPGRDPPLRRARD